MPGSSISEVALVLRPTKRLWREVWEHRLDYLFISPFFILFGLFSAFPLGWALALSFSSWRGFGAMRWVGLDNYRAMVRDIYIANALKNTLIFAAILVPTGIFLALTFAVLLNIRNLRGRGIYRTIYFLPYITSTVIVAIIFQQFLDDVYGWINGFLRMVGLPTVPWLRGIGWPKLSVVMLCHWQGVGYNTLIFLGGLQGIDPEIYEAARIDGATPWQIFWRITLPLLRPIILFVSILGSIGVLNMFSQPYMLTDWRSGPGRETITLTLRLYQVGVAGTRYGDAAALGFLTGALVIGISFLQLRLLRTWRQ